MQYTVNKPNANREKDTFQEARMTTDMDFSLGIL